MLNTKENQINFLDSLFTQKDFYFLNSLEEEIELIKQQIEKQEQKREVIIEIINYCESNITNPKVTDVFDNIKKSFILVNSNIKSLLSLKQKLSDINSNIVNLLVTIESNPHDKDNYMVQADKLSNDISNYSNFCVTIKTEIANNDLTLNRFLSSKKFKSIFDNSSDKKTNLDNNTENNIIKEDNIIKNDIIEDNITEDKKDDFTETTPNTIDKNYNNKILRISEKENKVFLPYNNSEIQSYLTQFPEDYTSAKDVIEKEFILPLAHYMKHPVLSRFRETYSLIRDREAKSIMEAIKYSMNLMFTYELNPTIIAACKTQEQLENYLNCLENNNLDNFKDFEIIFEINPL